MPATIFRKFVKLLLLRIFFTEYQTRLYGTLWFLETSGVQYCQYLLDHWEPFWITWQSKNRFNLSNISTKKGKVLEILQTYQICLQSLDPHRKILYLHTSKMAGYSTDPPSFVESGKWSCRVGIPGTRHSFFIYCVVFKYRNKIER